MMTKRQLRAAIERFMGDKGRVISIRNLCELAGISEDTFTNVFVHRTTPITPTTQIRFEKALTAVKNGEIRVMRNPDRTVTVQYRRSIS